MEKTLEEQKSKSHKEFETLLSQDLNNRKFKEGEITTGVVSEIGRKFIFLDLGLKSEGAIPIEEFKFTKEIDKIKVGSKVNVLLEKIENRSGDVVVSREKARKAQSWKKMEKAFENKEEVTCAIILKPIQKLIGAIGLTIDKRFNRAELGYWVGKEYWNQGYCTEASKVILKYGFYELGLHRIIATHIMRNPASGKVMKKIGMKKEGILREHVIKWDKYEDVVSYGILKKEWENIIKKP